MGLVKEKYHLGLLPVPGFRQRLKQFRHHPEHKGRVHGRIVDQLPAIQDLDGTPAVTIRTDPVCNVKCRFAKKLLPAFRFQCDQRAQNSPQALFGKVSVPSPVFLCVFGYILDHGAQVLTVKKQQPFIVRNLE